MRILNRSVLIEFVGLAMLLGVSLRADSPAPTPAPPRRPVQPADAADRSSGPDTRKLYDLGKELFDRYAPDEVKNDYDFPSYDQWQDFANRLQKALEAGSLEDLAAFEPEARHALDTLQYLPQFADYADWLSERLDLIEAAKNASRAPVATPAPTPAPFVTPSPAPADLNALIPHYRLWYDRVHTRPQPDRAKQYMPLLKMIFAAEGLPPEFAWLAEVESSLNPAARSPAGALGLYQLMPSTARSLGLSLIPFDERTNPGKSARAAAQLLRRLYARFDSWPLAVAAYNAGEGRVASVLKSQSATRFAEISSHLPAETRMYVPKVFATLAVRENAPPERWLHESQDHPADPTKAAPPDGPVPTPSVTP